MSLDEVLEAFSDHKLRNDGRQFAVQAQAQDVHNVSVALSAVQLVQQVQNLDCICTHTHTHTHTCRNTN